MLQCTILQAFWNYCYSEPSVFPCLPAVLSNLHFSKAIKRSEADKCSSYGMVFVMFLCSCYIKVESSHSRTRNSI